MHRFSNTVTILHYLKALENTKIRGATTKRRGRLNCDLYLVLFNCRLAEMEYSLLYATSQYTCLKYEDVLYLLFKLLLEIFARNWEDLLETYPGHWGADKIFLWFYIVEITESQYEKGHQKERSVDLGGHHLGYHTWLTSGGSLLQTTQGCQIQPATSRSATTWLQPSLSPSTAPACNTIGHLGPHLKVYKQKTGKLWQGWEDARSSVA